VESYAVLTAILKEHNALIFKAKQCKTLTQLIKAPLSSGTLGNTRTMTQLHVPKDLALHDELDLQNNIDFLLWTYMETKMYTIILL
jgi:hypothetical protein